MIKGLHMSMNLNTPIKHHFKHHQDFKVCATHDSDGKILPATVNNTPSGYTPAQIRTAYGIDKLSLDGTGQTIAIIGAYNAPTLINDFKFFDSYFHINNPNALTLHSMGYTTDAGWALEASLDVQWSHAIAPKANILAIQAASNSLRDLIAAINYANSHGATVISMSWGSTEFSTQTNYDTYFSTSGITYVASSGDEGGIVNWPSVSSKVLSVGGTSLHLSGNTFSETAWNGSGGSVSKYTPLPLYQSAAGLTGKRNTPDISAIADPNIGGVPVYDTTTYSGQSGWFTLGGTSCSAPILAGIVALINQSRRNANKANLTTNQLQSGLYSILKNGSYSTDLNDIISGTAGANISKIGYDLCTGCGSPKCAPLTSIIASPPTILTGSGVPGNVGVNGNYYIDLTSGKYYSKSNNNWNLLGSIVTTVATPSGQGLVNDITNL
jgi:subtilase family serine protease